MEDQISIVQMDSAEIQILREKATIDVAVSTANAFPRDESASVAKSLYIATKTDEIAAKCNYAVPRGGKAITGPSVHLARILFQNWKNLRGESKVVAIETKEVVSEAYVWDLENNNALKTTVRRSIMTKSGRMTDDMITVTGNAANAIAFRNALFGVIPAYVTDEVYAATKAKIIGVASEFSRRLKKVFEGFKNTYGKDEAAVMNIVGKTEKSQITPDDLVVLIGVGTALKDGDTTLEIVFKEPKKDKAEEVKDKKEKIKANKEADKAADPETASEPEQKAEEQKPAAPAPNKLP